MPQSRPTPQQEVLRKCLQLFHVCEIAAIDEHKLVYEQKT